MRTLACLIAGVCLLAGTAIAEDKPNPDQLKKAYDDALAQLKVAQDSKSTLARENEKLTKQVEDLKKEIAAGQGQMENLRRQISDADEKTFHLRAYQAAWQSFLRAHPDLLMRWRAFLADDVLALPSEREPLWEPNYLPAPGEPMSVDSGLSPSPSGRGPG